MPSPERFGRSHRRESAASGPEPGENRRDDLLERLEHAVGAIHDSESFRRYLDVQSRFHRYSWGNVALILSQRPDATAIAGYNTWLTLHRFVRRGEKGIRILAPMTRKEEPEDEGDTTRRRLFFRPVSVFDISQTDGEPLPQVHVPTLEGEEGARLMDGLLGLASREGVHVALDRGELPEEAAGAYWPQTRRIVVRGDAMRQMVKTLAHELGHHEQHRLYGNEAASREEQETLAESVAYVVCGHHGVDTGERSFPYIATWAKDKAVLKGALQRIQQVSARIINGLEERDKPEPTDQT